ncbi:hypothetical protein DXG01_012963 [Tephrocybe rancida]|nr:hypothetical protein DXG01_012963 [Tephrocybe rancida]
MAVPVDRLNLILSSDSPSTTLNHDHTVSEILDLWGKVSITGILECHKCLLAGTTVHSEHTILFNPKFVEADKAHGVAVENGTEIPKMLANEASQWLHIAQDQDISYQRAQPRKDHKHRWKALSQGMRVLLNPGELPNLSTKNVLVLFLLCLHSFVIIRTVK